MEDKKKVHIHAFVPPDLYDYLANGPDADHIKESISDRMIRFAHNGVSIAKIMRNNPGSQLIVRDKATGNEKEIVLF
jgi:hypothetical protein